MAPRVSEHDERALALWDLVPAATLLLAWAATGTWPDGFQLLSSLPGTPNTVRIPNHVR